MVYIFQRYRIMVYILWYIFSWADFGDDVGMRWAKVDFQAKIDIMRYQISEKMRLRCANVMIFHWKNYTAMLLLLKFSRLRRSCFNTFVVRDSTIFTGRIGNSVNSFYT